MDTAFSLKEKQPLTSLKTFSSDKTKLADMIKDDEKEEKNRTLKKRLVDHNNKVKLLKAKKLTKTKKMFKPMPIQFPSPDRRGILNPLDTPQQTSSGPAAAAAAALTPTTPTAST